MIKICIETGWGNLLAELYDKQAPRTTAHFLAYVDEGHYDGASIYRTARRDNVVAGLDGAMIEVIEGGYYNPYYENILRAGLAPGQVYEDELAPKGTHPTIMVETTAETGIKHLDGVLSMGRTSPDMVDDCFFICVGNQPELDYGGARSGDGLGFSAFGRIVSGMDLVRKINKSSSQGQKLLEDVPVLRIYRV